MKRIPFCARRDRGHQVRPVVAALLIAGLAIGPAFAADDPKAAPVDFGRVDPRLKGFHAPAGFRLEVVADDVLLANPVGMTFDDSGRIYVGEWSPGGRTFDVWDSVTLGDGTKVRIHRRRKSSSDQIKRLTDTNGDGQFDAAEVVVEGVEQPSALLWIRNALYVTASGRLERWNDLDGDGHLETKTVLIDGFGAVDARGLTGLTLGPDGYLYLTTGDNETHAFNPTGERADLSRSGGLFRCRLDGSDLTLVTAGFRDPRGGVAFDHDLQPTLIDDDGQDGSKLAGVRLLQPGEQADYGWRTLPGANAAPDHLLGATDGERPGLLTGFARLGSTAPSDFIIYGGTLLPAACRGLLIVADSGRHAVRGFKVTQAGAVATLAAETTLLAADDDRFCPTKIVVGADAALYVLDRREAKLPAASTGRIYRFSFAADPKPSTTPTTAPNNKWERITALTTDQLQAQILPGLDYGAAERALHELVGRGSGSRSALLTVAANPSLPVHVRLLAIEGARQLWSDEVEASLTNLLVDTHPEVRRLAAQALGSEPKRAEPRIAAKLLERLEDPDGRVVREIALGIGRHGATNPRQPAPVLVRWLYAHPQADRATRDAVLRGLERLGDVGVDEVALAVRTRRGNEREDAVRLYSALRAGHAAEELLGLIKIPDITNVERATLIRQYADFPAEVVVSTTGLVDWMLKHPEVQPVVKLAALETCRLVGNPASALVLAYLDDEDETVRIAAADFAAVTRPPGAMGKIANRVGDEARSDLERLLAARSFRTSNPANFAPLDAAFLAASSPELRRSTLRALADADRPKAIAALTSVLAGPDPVLRRDAIVILGEDVAGTQVIGKAYLDQTLTRDDLPGVLRALRAHDAIKEIRQTLAAVKLDAIQGPSALAASKVRLQAVEHGNPWAGLEVFFRKTAQCASCHQVGGQGGRVGPPLDLAAHGLTAEQLIDAIQHPSREIKPGFEPTRLALANPPGGGEATKNGRSVKLKAPLAGLDRAEIAADPAQQPAMPEGLDLDLTPQEFADLVAFLLDAPAQAVIKADGPVAVDRWVVAGPFGLGADSLRLPIDRVELSKSLSGQGGRTCHWLPLAASRSGQINLAGLVGSDPGRAYAATEVRTSAPQTAWLSGSTRGPARVYLNGAKVLDLADRSATSGRTSADDGPSELARVTLKAGVNGLIVAFDSPSLGEPTATFRLAAPKPVEIRGPQP